MAAGDLRSIKIRRDYSKEILYAIMTQYGCDIKVDTIEDNTSWIDGIEGFVERTTNGVAIKGLSFPIPANSEVNGVLLRWTRGNSNHSNRDNMMFIELEPDNAEEEATLTFIEQGILYIETLEIRFKEVF